jgi:hypothetical protein
MMTPGDVDGSWTKVKLQRSALPMDVLPTTNPNTVSFDFPGGTNSIFMLAVFAAGILVGYFLYKGANGK